MKKKLLMVGFIIVGLNSSTTLAVPRFVGQAFCASAIARIVPQISWLCSIMKLNACSLATNKMFLAGAAIITIPVVFGYCAYSYLRAMARAAGGAF